jgi:hypothetical protein
MFSDDSMRRVPVKAFRLFGSIATMLCLALAGMGQSPGPVESFDCQPCQFTVGAGGPEFSIVFHATKQADGAQVVNEIVVSRGGAEIQRLQVHNMMPASADQGAVFRGVDINFDGLQDIEFITSRGVANAYADYWIYKPGEAKFAYLGNYPIFTVDQEKHRLKTYERNGDGGMSYSSKEYVFVDGKLQLMRSETQEETARYGVFQLTIRERVNGVLRVKLRKTVRTPMSPKQ